MRAPKVGAKAPKATRVKAAALAHTAELAAFAAAKEAGGTFVKCSSFNHGAAVNDFSNASAIVVILAENLKSIPNEDLDDALWGVRRLINHGLELLGEQVRP